MSSELKALREREVQPVLQRVRQKKRRHEERKGWVRILLHPRLMAFVTILAIWWLSSAVTNTLLDLRVLPDPYTVFKVAVTDTIPDPEFLGHLGSTLLRILVGFTITLIIGMAIGIVMGVRPYWESFFSDFVVIGLTIPSLAWAVIGVLWFGIKPMTPVFATFMITFPFVTINIWEGMNDVDKELVDMGRAFGVRRKTIIREIYIPSLMPFFFAAIRFGFAVAWKIVILAEAFGSSNGIGYMIFQWYGLFNMRQVLAWVVIFTILMLVLEYGVIRVIERRVLSWRAQAVL
ncbi:MAG: ABC transporter permease [Nitrospinota bacterium]